MKNKTELFYILLLIVFVIIAFLFFGKNIYSPYSDIGRELYITEQVKNGAILYKDIFNVYSPLGYWVNALIVKLLGNQLNTFYYIGLSLSVLTIIPIFLISKAYTNKHLAFFIALFLVYSCTFYTSISNWITPYSYSIVYALCSTLWSFYFLHSYIDKKEKKYIYIASFLSGLSICFKYEFCGLYIFILCVAIYKKEFLKTFLYSVIIPIICFLILLFQGCTLQTFQEAFIYMIGISKSDSTQYFYEYAKIAPTIENIKYSFMNILYQNFKSIFAPICIINFVLLIINLKRKNKSLALLLFVSLITSIKSLGGISFEIYGTYFFPLLFIALVSSLYKTEKKIRTIYLCIICFILTIFYFSFTVTETKKLTQINTQKGEMNIPIVFYNSTIEILDYLKDTKNKNILIFPEGTIINYLTNTTSDDYLYYLIPPNNDIFDESFIKDKIKQGKMNYIITTNIQYPWFNEKSFMTGWGKEYIEIIKEEYKQEMIIGENLKFYVYKHDIIK